MPREHQNRTPARPRRARVRAVMFAWHRDEKFTEADCADLRARLNLMSDVEWAFALHDKDAGRDHLQGCARFPHPRDVATIEALLPEFVVEPLKGRLAFQKYVRYLGHDGVYPVISNVDRDVLLAGLPNTKINIEDLESDVFWGRRTCVAVGEEYPKLFAQYHARLERAALNGVRHRNSPDYRAARAKAQAAPAPRRALAPAPQPARAEAQASAPRPRVDDAGSAPAPVADAPTAEAESIRSCPDEGADRRVAIERTCAWLLAERCHYAEHAAAHRDADDDDEFWLIAAIADREGIPGGEGDRRWGVEDLIGAEATKEALVAWFEARYRIDAIDAASDYERRVDHDVAEYEWREADAISDSGAFDEVLAVRGRAGRWPDLYPMTMPHVRLPQDRRAALLSAQFKIEGESE